MFGPKIFNNDKPPEALKQSDQSGHEWERISLLDAVVFNCKHCGCKKEDYEKNPSLKCTSRSEGNPQ